MANNSFLLCRSEVWPGESLGSYLVRLSRLNGYGAANEVERLCRERMAWDDKLAQPYRPETYEVISQLTKILPYDVYKMTGHSLAPVVTPPEQTVETIRLSTGEDVPFLAWGNAKGHLGAREDARYCPRCLQERPYHRRAWLPVMAAVCLEHQTLLARGCPQCGQVVRVQDVVSGRCPQCYFELADAPVQSVAGDAFGLWAQQAVLHWLGLADAPISPLSTLPDQPPAVLYRMLFTLRPALLRVQRSRWPYWYRGVVPLPNQYDLLAWADMMRYKILEPKWVYLLAATAFKALADWPEGFYAFLDAYRQRRDGRLGDTLRSSFGLVFGQCLERHWLSPPFQFVQEAFDRYLVERFTLNPSILHTRRYQESEELRRAFPFITTAEAARLLHTTPKMIRRLVRRGELIPYRPLETGDKKRDRKRGKKQAKSYQFRLVRRDEVETLRLRWQTAVPLPDVTSVLGVSKSVV
ncbi:MAG TPA: helix-turn-helix domain-containing protein, partial [Anaerolineae bacterium]|nr:helix-turn-helix domain-containing protein [Anaerolineae bacterium]